MLVLDPIGMVKRPKAEIEANVRRQTLDVQGSMAEAKRLRADLQQAATPVERIYVTHVYQPMRRHE